MSASRFLYIEGRNMKDLAIFGLECWITFRTLNCWTNWSHRQQSWWSPILNVSFYAATFPAFPHGKNCEHRIVLNRKSDIQINKVDPIMDERKHKFNGKRVPDQILKYHRVNDVQKFQFSRPIYPNGNEKDNEFGNLWLERTIMITSNPLPGILTWFPVVSSKTFMVRTT